MRTSKKTRELSLSPIIETEEEVREPPPTSGEMQ